MRGITKQEFYRLRSKFRLLEAVYHDDEEKYDIKFLVSKLSRKELSPQLIQLVIAKQAVKTSATWMDRLKNDLTRCKMFRSPEEFIFYIKDGLEHHSEFMSVYNHIKLHKQPTP